MRFLARCCAWLGVLVLVGAGSLAVPANAANPHLVKAAPAIDEPTLVSPGNLTWDASLDVPFKLAGLGNNQGLTVMLNARLTYFGAVGATTTLNTLTAVFNVPLLSGFTLTVEATANGPGANALSTVAVTTKVINLTSDHNGNVTGTLTIPGVVNSSIPDNLACARVSWTLITLTFGSETVALPDVSGEFDSTGSFCH